MAKLKGPLFSLGASGKLADTLVYAPWKGLNIAREYVIPANPKTTLQTTQRGYLTYLVSEIHLAQAEAARPMIAIDTLAYALLASTYAAPRTWFNQAVKIGVDMLVAGLKAGVYRGVVISQGPTAIGMNTAIHGTCSPTAGYIYWGTSKTALIHRAAITLPGGGLFEGTCTGLTAGVKYYFQMRMTAPANCLGFNSGIYHATKT